MIFFFNKKAVKQKKKIPIWVNRTNINKKYFFFSGSKKVLNALNIHVWIFQSTKS